MHEEREYAETECVPVPLFPLSLSLSPTLDFFFALIGRRHVLESMEFPADERILVPNGQLHGARLVGIHWHWP